ncbi:MAG: DNA mismatch endonuclease Vsr [Tardiphaga sp.]|nr:DNA mismatch endonuclease Vsr [Tardiphaga sp.]
MALVKGKNTKPELFVQGIVSELRFRFDTHGANVPGRPDLVFARRRKVIFVHGCFWHRHGRPGCWRSRLPKTRLDFWQPKLAANVTRDRKVGRQLRKDGWKALVIWECEAIPKNRTVLARKIQKFLRA